MSFKKTLSLLAFYCVTMITAAGYMLLEPGVVIVSKEDLWNWKFTSDSKDGEARPRGFLRYYGKDGTGSFTAAGLAK